MLVGLALLGWLLCGAAGWIVVKALAALVG